MSVQNNETDTATSDQSEGEISGKQSAGGTLKTTVIVIAVSFVILAVLSWAAGEFGLMPTGPAK